MPETPPSLGVTSPRPLVVLAHGTASAAGRAVAEKVTERAAETLGVAPRLGFVDVCGPTAEEVLDGLLAPIVVPLFLASGYHVRVDIPSVLAAATNATVTPALGSGDAVVEVLAERIREVEPRPGSVVLTGAGSSNPDARAEVAAAARALSDYLTVPTVAAFLTAAEPTPSQAYEQLADHRPVVLATHLLAPGHFHDRLAAVGAELGAPVSAPIGAHPRIVAEVVARYRSVVTEDH